MKSALSYPTWDQIDVGCSRLAIQIQQFNPQPTLIVGLSRGGLIPAVRISHLLKLPFATIEYSSDTGNGETASGVASDLEYQIAYLSEKYGSSNMNVVVVDDIVDTGYTMRDVVACFVDHQWNVASAGLFVRSGSVHEPGISWQSITENDPWIHFPWEL